MAGGCATCPYMKMNELDGLFRVLELIREEATEALLPYRPKTYTEQVGGRTAADLGSEPILHMRHFQQHAVMAPTLLAQVIG